nr:MAG TPA: hypothetical protein [Myoviridae sp. ctqgO2]
MISYNRVNWLGEQCPPRVLRGAVLHIQGRTAFVYGLLDLGGLQPKGSMTVFVY